MRLKLVGMPYYHGATTGYWTRGDVVDVEPAEALRLLADFGSAFAAVAPEPSAPKKKGNPGGPGTEA